MREKINEFLTEERLKTVCGYMVNREIMVRLFKPDKNNCSDQSTKFEFRTPLNDIKDYYTEIYAGYSTPLLYGDSFQFVTTIKIKNKKFKIECTLTLKEDINHLKTQENKPIYNVMEYSSEYHDYDKKISSDIYDKILNELVNSFICNYKGNKYQLRLICYNHIINSIEKTTNFIEPVGYHTGAYFNNILTRFYIRTIEMKLDYKENGKYIVHNKISFTLSGDPDKEESYEIIETSDNSEGDVIHVEHKIHNKHLCGLTYHTDQVFLIKTGVKKLLGL